MKIPIEWLKDYVEIKAKPEELAHRLTMAGLETGAVEAGVLDVDVLPNRGDCLSVLGVAREIAAVLNCKLKTTKLKTQSVGKNLSINIKVEDKKLCPRYMARMIENVKVGESPDWIKNRLLLAGLRPINNVVDVTNYLLIELGQPMHAFDADTLKGGQIIVRRAGAGEKMTTLDGVERKLDKEMLVIADAERPIALAGVMGGANTEVSNSTVNVLLESACFDPVSISKTSKAVKLRTEASIRFEKGVDWSMVEEAMDRAADLIASVSGGKVMPGKADVKAKDQKRKIIELRMDRISKVLGTPVTIKESSNILKKLGFQVKTANKKLRVEVPFWRAADIEREIDLIEEISRIFGYDRIRPSRPRIKGEEGLADQGYYALRKIRDVLAGCGLNEVQTFSLVDPGMADKNALVVANPLTVEESVMRTAMIPSLLKVISYNIRHQVEDVKIFEIGKVFLPDSEKLTLAGAMTRTDFFKVKGMLENLFSEFSNGWELESISDDYYHPGKSAEIILGPHFKPAGRFGALHPAVLRKWDLKEEIYAFEIDLEVLLSAAKRKMHKPLPKFPKVERDLAMFVPEGITSKMISDTIKSAGGELVEEVKLFDRYKDSQAYRISFRDAGKTLIDEIVNQKFEAVQSALVEKLKVQIRK